MKSEGRKRKRRAKAKTKLESSQARRIEIQGSKDPTKSNPKIENLEETTRDEKHKDERTKGPNKRDANPNPKKEKRKKKRERTGRGRRPNWREPLDPIPQRSTLDRSTKRPILIPVRRRHPSHTRRPAQVGSRVSRRALRALRLCSSLSLSLSLCRS